MITDEVLERARRDKIESDERLAALEAGLERERAGNAEITAFLKMYSRYTAAAVESSVTQIASRVLESMTIGDAAEAVLTMLGGEAKMTDILEQLRKAHVLKGKPQFQYGTVVGALSRREDRVEKVRPGVWRIKQEERNGAH